ncbi:Type 1 glutamine amidotransferase-like domain-containing protein [Oceanobacillus manasiensis]|uniref:Type 1 glutamine amidotransferase-like domain-containing protein n=1 Tax=Oceanobacillus manasiensis TaxID=586413 RepID=UPI0005A600DC|nr:Type 1 glutamine amidotransferase-like domain-containing protein [Oceanobacillus manasiensis]
MGSLILSGGGGPRETLEINKYFAQEIDNNKTILYIPIAGDPEYRTYESSYNYMNSVFNPQGINEITMWLDIKNKTIDDMKQFSAVYVSGGNTFSLLNDLKSTRFDAVLTQFLIEGGTIYGQSAGAIIFGNNIKIIPDVNLNNVGLKNFHALNRVKNCCIWCHYKKEDDVVIEQAVKEYGLPVIAIPDGTAVILKDNRIRVIGNEPAYLFESYKKDLLTEEVFQTYLAEIKP